MVAMVDGFYQALDLVTINFGLGANMSLDRLLVPVVDRVWGAIVQMRNETPLWSIRESLPDRAGNELSLS